MRGVMVVAAAAAALCCGGHRSRPTRSGAAPVAEREAGAARPAAGDPLARRTARIRAALEKERRARHIAGLALAVVERDRVVFLEAAGLRDAAHDLPATVDTTFSIGSCTKSFTALAALISQERHVLSIDDRPRRFLPTFRMADADSDASVTIRDMLSHRTGLASKADLAAVPGVLTREEYVRAATSARPEVALRSEFRYSNAMFTAVGEILGRANHSTWEKVVEADILRPAGMTSTTTTLREWVESPRRTLGYQFVDGAGLRPIDPPASLDTMGPAGSIASTARDMARWLRLMLGEGELDGVRIASAASVGEVTRPHIRVGPALEYALGWGVFAWNGHRVIGHTGGSDGISAVVSFMPDRGVGFALLANTTQRPLVGIGTWDAILWPAILDEAAPVAPAAPTPPASPPSAGSRAAGPSAGAAPSAPAADLPAAGALLARMVRAAGGDRTLRRHRSLEIHAVKTYEHQGVRAELTILARAPAMRVEDEVWTAAGRRFARVRNFADGTRGAQETTFGQDAAYGDEELRRARRDFAFRWLLDLRRLYRDIQVVARAPVDGEDCYVLALTPDRGEPVRLSVSARTARVVRREAGGESSSFADYRRVDGQLVPFLTTIRDALGETTVRVERVRFGAAIPPAAFGPAAPLRY